MAQTSSDRGQCDARDYQCQFIAQRYDGCAGTAGAKVAYHRRSVEKTAMFRIKTLLSSHLRLRDYDAQVCEAMAMVKALNRITLLGMPHIVRIA